MTNKMGKYRVLWLINHITLRPFEVPMLLDMGFEVYCAKKFPRQEGNMSANVDYSYDSTLTIPKDVIDKLNDENLYQNVPQHIVEIMNEYFDIAFVSFFPNQLRMLLNSFKGTIIMQPFGLDNTQRYTSVIEATIGRSYLDTICNLGDRFYFGQAYENIAEIEDEVLSNRAVYLPIGLKNAFVDRKWVGGDKRILFVCPRIETNSYYKAIYEKFKKEFRDYEYLIGGAQPLSVNDSRVMGYIPDEQYKYNMTHLDVMFYHSQEKRHLHYHPLEAVKNGMPLIYMQGGVLEQIAGRKLAGACESYREAKDKINRIFQKDRQFIEQVITDQAVLLRPFQYDYCRQHWNSVLTKVCSDIEKRKQSEGSVIHKKRARIGIILTEAYTGGVLDFTLRLVECIKKGIDFYGDNVELVFGHKKSDVYEKKNYFDRIEKLGITIRKFDFRIVDDSFVNNLYGIKGSSYKVSPGNYSILDDGVNYFDDCDYLILTVDRVPDRFVTLKPYVVVAHDYIQRYLPDIMPVAYEKIVFDLQRKAEAVLVMSEPTKEDAINYAGIPKQNVRLLPLLFDNIENAECIEPEQTCDKYFLWATNPTVHKNHLRALEALSLYYSQGGRLKCYITGAETEKFIPSSEKADNEYIQKIQEKIKHDKYLKENLLILGHLSKAKYYKLLKGAQFFFHCGLIDNGNMASFDAALLGIPSISSDYPAMRYYEAYLKLPIVFFDAFDSESIYRGVLYMENESCAIKKKMPKPDALEKYTINDKYIDVYTSIKELWGL